MSDRILSVPDQRSRRFWIIPAGLVAAVVLGLAITRFGPSIFALLSGPVLAVLLFGRPELGLYAITLTLPIEDLIPGVGTATGTRLLGMAVFGIWFVRKFLRRESWMPLLKTPLVWSTLIFLAWAFISMLWAEDREATVLGLLSQVQLIFLALIVIDLVQSWDKAVWVARLLVLGGVIAAIFTLEQYFIAGVRRAGDGVSGGINFTASSLVTLLPMAFYLIRSKERGFWMMLGSLYIPLGIVAITVTFSRFSYIMLIVVLAVHAWLLLRTRSKGFWAILLCGLIMAPFLTVPQEAVSVRVQSITPLLSDWFASTQDYSTQADARAFHWQVGFEMLNDSPLLGVGYGNFGVRFLVYQFDVQGTPEVFYNPRSPHSSYIGVLTETGLIGITLFLLILGAALRSLIKAGRRLKSDENSDHLYLAQAVYYMFLLQIFYGWALNTHMNKNFWLILGLSVVLYTLSRKQADEEIGGNDVH